MFWLTVIMLVLSLIAMARMYVPETGQKPAGIEDFSFPSAAERPIQVLVGTDEIKAPNVLWYGDLSHKKITKKERIFFSSKKIVIGHKYYLGMQLGLCYGEDVSIRQVKFGKEIAWQGDTRTEYPLVGSDVFADHLNINKPELFGGKEKGGGVSGKIAVYPGNKNTSAINAYLKRILGATVANPLKGLSYLVLENFYIGNSSRPEAISVVASRFPYIYDNNVADGYLIRRIGQDANPAFVIYDFLTNRQYGGSIPEHMVDVDSFKDAAKRLYDENMGISFVVDSGRSVGQVIKDIEQVIQASVITDPKTGKLKLKLIRNDYNPDTLLTFDPTNIRSVSDFSRGSLDTAVNELKLTYISREKGYEERYVISQNLGLQRHKGDTESQTVPMPMIRERQLAAKVVERELSALSVPLATCKIECNRSAEDLEIGDVVKLTWPILKIENLVMRVTGVDLGSPGFSAVKLTLTQDVFGVYRSIYTDGSEGYQAPVYSDPEPVSRFIITEAPRILEITESTGSILYAAEDPKMHLGFTLFTKEVTDPEWESTDEESFCPVFETLSSLPYMTWTAPQIIISGEEDLPSYSAKERREGLGLAIVRSAAGTEWISYGAHTETEDEEENITKAIHDVQRGLFGTVPLAHPVGAEIFFITEGFATTNTTYAGAFQFKAQTRATNGLLDLDTIPAQGLIEAERNPEHNLNPWPPGNVSASIALQSITINWRKRDGMTPSVTYYSDSVSHTSDTKYRVQLRSGNQVIDGKIVDGTEAVFDASVIEGYTDVFVRVVGVKDGRADSVAIDVSLT